MRTIEIVGLDLQADGGTHVANTREVGEIRVTGYESKGRINKRIRLELRTPPSTSRARAPEANCPAEYPATRGVPAAGAGTATAAWPCPPGPDGDAHRHERAHPGHERARPIRAVAPPPRPSPNFQPRTGRSGHERPQVRCGALTTRCRVRRR